MPKGGMQAWLATKEVLVGAGNEWAWTSMMQLDPMNDS
jgi:hypothetical protein